MPCLLGHKFLLGAWLRRGMSSMSIVATEGLMQRDHTVSAMLHMAQLLTGQFRSQGYASSGQSGPPSARSKAPWRR